MEPNEFELLFGASLTEIKEVCLLTPFSNRFMKEAAGISSFKEGGIYKTGEHDSFSWIVSPMGAPFCGDAVLYLAKSACKDLFFFGSCGASDGKRFPPGSMVCVEKALSIDGFTRMLSMEPPSQAKYADPELMEETMSRMPRGMERVTCLTAGSLKMESPYFAMLREKNVPVDVFDLEVAAVYAASSSTHMRSVAFLYVTDTLDDFPLAHLFLPSNRPLQREISRQSSQTFFPILHAISRTKNRPGPFEPS